MTETTTTGPNSSKPKGSDASSRVRFVWTSDRSGTIRLLTEDPRLATLKISLEETPWPKGSKARQALDARATFVNEALTLESAEGPLAITLSGTPLKGEGGTFEGFRGFGTITLTTPKPNDAPETPVKSRLVDAETAPGLTEIERQAFRDIARALGERPSRSSPDRKSVV